MIIAIDPSRLLPFGPCGWRLSDESLPPGDDEWRPSRSGLTVYEDGQALGPGHELHDVIRNQGRGAYSHWRRMVLFSASDNSDPRTNKRLYTLRMTAIDDGPAVEPELAAMIELAGKGQPVDGGALAKLAAWGTPERRGWIYYRLGDACFDAGSFQDGSRFAYRAWRLGLRRRSAWLAIIEWLGKNQRFDEQDIVFRTAAQAAQAQGDSNWAAEIAIRYEAHVYGRYPMTRHMPFQDDFIAPAIIGTLAAARPIPRPLPPGRLKIGYVSAAETEANYSALPSIAAELVMAHDPAAVEAHFISLHPRETCLANNPFFPAIEQALGTSAGAVHFMVAQAAEPLERAHRLNTMIAALDLDVVVFLGQSGMALLLAAMRPARLIACLGLGDVHLYSSQAVDVTAHFTLKPAMDGLCRSAVVPCFMPQDRFAIPKQVAARSSLGLPEDAVVVVASARPVKYREPDFWAALSEFMELREDVWLAAVGLEPDLWQELIAAYCVPSSVTRRVRPLGWRNDHQAVLAAGDIYLDTFPNGGGYAVFEAINLGLPAITVEDDYLEPFDERNWAPAAELLEGTGVPRNRLTERLRTLADDKGAREEAHRAARRSLDRLADAGKTAAALERVFRSFPAGV